MSTHRRPLQGRTVSLSISETDDSADRGFPTWQVNRVTVQLAAALIGQGASVVFGHDWREDGIMETVHNFAQQVQPSLPLSPAEAMIAGQPLLRNVLPWPDEPTLPREALDMLSSTLIVESAGLPRELLPAEQEARGAGPESSLYQYIRARGLTFLRHRLGNAAQARLCVGGRRSGYAGRYPGVIEEALLALKAGKPLYLAGLLGGATHDVMDAVEGKEMPEDFCRPNRRVIHLYEHPPIREVDQTTQDDRTVDRAAVWGVFKKVGVRGIVSRNKLTLKENEELLHTPVLDRVIQLLLTGLSRLQAR